MSILNSIIEGVPRIFGTQTQKDWKTTKRIELKDLVRWDENYVNEREQQKQQQRIDEEYRREAKKRVKLDKQCEILKNLDTIIEENPYLLSSKGYIIWDKIDWSELSIEDRNAWGEIKSLIIRSKIKYYEIKRIHIEYRIAWMKSKIGYSIKNEIKRKQIEKEIEKEIEIKIDFIIEKNWIEIAQEEIYRKRIERKRAKRNKRIREKYKCY